MPGPTPRMRLAHRARADRLVSERTGPAGADGSAGRGIVQRPARAPLSRAARAAIVAAAVGVVAYGLALALTWVWVPGGGSSAVYTTEQPVDWFTAWTNTTVVAGLVAAAAAGMALVLAVFVVARHVSGRRRAS
jgi:ABC-type Fe3+ transport system permease subunit